MSVEPDHLVTVSTWEADPGREEEMAALGRRIQAIAEETPGHLRGTVLHQHGSREFNFVHTFRDADALELYQSNPERDEIRAELARIGKRVGKPQRVTGLENWFESRNTPAETMKPPPRWKMWLASFVGAYPLVVLFQWLLAPSLEDLPLLIRSAMFPLILLSLMTYAMMPLVTRVLRGWLYPSSDS